MKIDLAHTIRYFDTDATNQAKLSSLFQLLQNAALRHTEQVGYHMDTLIRNGQGWVLQKMEIRIRRYPEYRERIDAITWSRSIQGAKAKREFLVTSDCETLLSASSVWIFFDALRRKIIRSPQEMEDRYTIHDESACNPTLDRWKARQDIQATVAQPVTIRHSDYDPMGHVNNTSYIDFLETAVNRKIKHGLRISDLKIQYLRELDPSVDQVEVGFQETDDRFLFTISSRHAIHAAGDFVLPAA